MHEAAHWISDYSSQPTCAAVQLCEHGRPIASDSISDFERLRTLQNLPSNAHCGLAIALQIPPQAASCPAAYTRALLSEAALLYRHLPAKLRLHQLQVQGDPAVFTAHQLTQLFDGLGKHFIVPATNFAWFGIEIQPQQADWSMLGSLRDAGFNRITLQTGADSQRATQHLYEAARALQYNTISIRIQTPDDSLQTLQQALRLQPDRILLNTATAPAAATDLLQESGYLMASPHCFVLPDDELAEAANQPPTHDCKRLTLGLGSGACSHLGRLHYCNESDLQAYIDSLTAHRLPAAKGHRCSGPVPPQPHPPSSQA